MRDAMSCCLSRSVRTSIPTTHVFRFHGICSAGASGVSVCILSLLKPLSSAQWRNINVSSLLMLTIWSGHSPSSMRPCLRPNSIRSTTFRSLTSCRCFGSCCCRVHIHVFWHFDCVHTTLRTVHTINRFGFVPHIKCNVLGRAVCVQKLKWTKIGNDHVFFADFYFAYFCFCFCFLLFCSFLLRCGHTHTHTNELHFLKWIRLNGQHSCGIKRNEMNHEIPISSVLYALAMALAVVLCSVSARARTPCSSSSSVSKEIFKILVQHEAERNSINGCMRKGNPANKQTMSRNEFTYAGPSASARSRQLPVRAAKAKETRK